MNTAILGIGSNYNSKENIQQAANLLNIYFTDILYSEAVFTEPIGYSNPSLFLNQVAIIKTSFSQSEIKLFLKQIEKTLGRTPESKASECIPIDIDLLQWNEIILKPDDMQRFYITECLRSFSSSITD